MARTLAVLGVIAAVISLVVGMGWMSLVGSGTEVYPLRIVGNSSSGYAIVPADKPLGDVYHVAFDGAIRWELTNNTNPQEAVRFRLGEGEFLPNDCPVNWTNCEYYHPNLPYGQTKPVDATPQKGSGDSYDFYISIGKHPDGDMKRIDPELQIDDSRNFVNRLIAILAALLSACFFFVAWWTRRRSSPATSR